MKEVCIYNSEALLMQAMTFKPIQLSLLKQLPRLVKQSSISRQTPFKVRGDLRVLVLVSHFTLWMCKAHTEWSDSSCKFVQSLCAAIKKHIASSSYSRWHKLSPATSSHVSVSCQSIMHDFIHHRAEIKDRAHVPHTTEGIEWLGWLLIDTHFSCDLDVRCT